MTAGGRAADLVAELHRRQREMYAGGPVEPVAALLAEDVVWHVPGRSPIAGDHRMEEGEAFAQFVAGSAPLGGR